MSTDQAVILAAGRGTRLAAACETRPKGFLCLGEKPIVQESIDKLIAHGIKHIVIVTGHQAEHYHDLADHYDGVVTTVHNPRYTDTGSMYSLHCLRHRVSGDFLLLESDLVYESRALSAILGSDGENIILVSGFTRAGDEVYVEAVADRLVNLSKTIDPNDDRVVGELVGISRVSGPLFTAMNDAAAARFRESFAVEYEECLVATVEMRAIHCLQIVDLLWAEIDTPEHLKRVQEKIYPAILRADNWK